MTHDPDMNAAHGGPVAPPEQRNWGPGGPRAKSELIERWTPPTSIGWRAYHKSFFPPGGLVTPWIRFKVMSTGVNVARRLWDQREELRAAYEAKHGSDPSRQLAPSPSGDRDRRGAVGRSRRLLGLPVDRHARHRHERPPVA
jgi:hypothetical protein